MAEQKKKPAAKKRPVAKEPVSSEPPELTRDQKRLLATYERRQALRRRWGMI